MYSNLIQKGAKTVMVGHIAQPAYVKAINPNATRKEMLRPASLSPELLTGLLRGKLGFNGLISTDATPMVGFTAAMKRCEAIPQAIAAGCDMILFNKSLEEDYGYLLTAVKKEKSARNVWTKLYFGFLQQKLPYIYMRRRELRHWFREKRQ